MHTLFVEWKLIYFEILWCKNQGKVCLVKQWLNNNFPQTLCHKKFVDKIFEFEYVDSILITKHEIKVQNYSGKLFNCTSGRRDFKGLFDEWNSNKTLYSQKTKKRRGFLYTFKGFIF